MRIRWISIPTAVVVAACATIMHGTSQDIGISSQPTGADVTADGRAFGRTPVTANLSRKPDSHTVSIRLAGYQPFEMSLTRHVSGWVWGNIVFGGLIGLAVDAITGGLYEIKPDQVLGQLQLSHASVTLRHDMLYVVLVATPDSTWERIGTLRPLAP